MRRYALPLIGTGCSLMAVLFFFSCVPFASHIRIQPAKSGSWRCSATHCTCLKKFMQRLVQAASGADCAFPIGFFFHAPRLHGLAFCRSDSILWRGLLRGIAIPPNSFASRIRIALAQPGLWRCNVLHYVCSKKIHAAIGAGCFRSGSCVSYCFLSPNLFSL